MSASVTMQLLAEILPTGTSVDPASVLIEEGISPETTGFPAAVVTCPQTEQADVTFGDTQDTYTIQVLLLDRWDSSARSLEAISGGLRAALERMRANVNAHRGLPSGGVDTVMSQPVRMRITLEGPVQDDSLGFPIVSGTLQIVLKSVYYQIGG